MAINSLKFMGGILHLKSTAGCQISSLIFGFRRDPIHIPCKIAEGLAHNVPKHDISLQDFNIKSFKAMAIPLI
jgi:hypothetical protein